MAFFPVDEALARHYTQGMYTRSRYPAGVHAKHIQVMQQMASTLKERSRIFDQITAPVLIVQGEEDYLILPGRGGSLLAEALPKARYELIPAMGHMHFNYAIEKRVAETIVAFIQDGAQSRES